MALKQMHRAKYGREEVVKVVRDAAGEPAHRLQPLRLPQLVLCRFALGDLIAQRLGGCCELGQRDLLGAPALPGHPQHQGKGQGDEPGQHEGHRRLAPPGRHEHGLWLRKGDEQRLVAHAAEAGQPFLTLRVRQPQPIPPVAANSELNQPRPRAVPQFARARCGRPRQHHPISPEQGELAPAAAAERRPVLLEIAGQHRAQHHAIEAALAVQSRPTHGEGQHAGGAADERGAEIQTEVAG